MFSNKYALKLVEDSMILYKNTLQYKIASNYILKLYALHI